MKTDKNEPEQDKTKRAAIYATLRESVGTQAAVARMLGVTNKTISHRELGKIEIKPEAMTAIESLAQNSPKP